MDDKAKAPNSLAKISVPKYLKGALVLNITFKKIDWDLTPDNIERHRDDETGGEYIDFYGVVVVRAIDDVGNFDTKVIADVDICDGLYCAIEEIEQYLNEGWPSVEVFYTTQCEAYGDGPTYKHGNDIGYILVVNMKAVYYAVLPGNRIAAILLILHTLTKMVILNCWILRIWHLRY